MKKIIFLIGIIVNVTLLNAQKSYHVSYNKSQDSYQFFENKLVQGKMEKVELKNTGARHHATKREVVRIFDLCHGDQCVERLSSGAGGWR